MTRRAFLATTSLAGASITGAPPAPAAAPPGPGT
ncbi:twin-arginine translocation signal domain-containing protein, partial [Actinomadura roseirufa]